MPMGTTSYFSLSMASSTDAADSSEISCSPLRPPNRIPTRSFFIDQKRLEDFLAEHRHCQLHRQHRRRVVLVDHRIHFYDLEAGHTAMVSDDLHRQVSLTVSSSALHRGADARRVFRIDPIHVERDMIA